MTEIFKTAMATIKEMKSTKSGIWYTDKMLIQVVKEGVKIGYFKRASITQIQWTEKGIKECYEGEQ